MPELNIPTLDAKIDTGARTTALHAVDHEVITLDGVPWVEFSVPIHNRRTDRRVRARLVDERDIKNTSGIPERRLVVRTGLMIGRHRWQIEVSLANRQKMEFDIILGRTAIRRRGILVDPGHSFLVGPPQPAVKRSAVKRSAARRTTPEPAPEPAPSPAPAEPAPAASSAAARPATPSARSTTEGSET